MLATLVPAAAGCGGHAAAPTALLDGSRVREPPVRLEKAPSPAVLTKVTVTDPRRVAPGSPEASCIARQANGDTPLGAVVRRIGVSSESVSFRAGFGVVGCDGTRSEHEGARRWCGGSYGRLFRGYLRDARLDIAGCRTVDGGPAAFAWLEPRRDARYIVVAQSGYSEVYPVTRGVPVRVATETGIESDPIAAVFEVSEHDAEGQLLRSYRLTARPSG